MSVFTSKQSQLEEDKAKKELQTLVSESKPESDIDLNFIFTRDIEFRQETIYFIVVDRFNDGDTENSEGENSELYDRDRQQWRTVG